MLPWASFPKRFPIDTRFAPENVALEAMGTGAFAGLHTRCRRGRAGAHGAPESIEVCWSFARPSSRRSCHIAVRRPAARSVTSNHRGCAETHPVTETVPPCLPEAVPGAVTPPVRPSLDFDLLASAVGVNRWALCAEALRVWDITQVREAEGCRVS
jgi:hypothetical protein